MKVLKVAVWVPHGPFGEYFGQVSTPLGQNYPSGTSLRSLRSKDSSGFAEQLHGPDGFDNEDESKMAARSSVPRLPGDTGKATQTYPVHEPLGGQLLPRHSLPHLQLCRYRRTQSHLS